MLRKLSFGTGNVNNKEKVKSLKQTTLTSKSLSSAPNDDLDDVAVISNPTQITYGSSRGLFLFFFFLLLFITFLYFFF